MKKETGVLGTYIKYVLNQFYATGLFLYPQKTSENQRFSDVFMDYRKKPVK